MARAVRLTSLLASCIVLACEDPAEPVVPPPPPPPPPGPPLVRDASPIQSDSLVYTLKSSPGVYEAWGSFSYTNTTGHTIYFARCFSNSTVPLANIRRSEVDTLLRSAVNVIWACVGGVPSGELAPGATVTIPLFLGSAVSPQAYPPTYAYERVGRFRVSFMLCSALGIDGCPLLPQPERQSNAFEVRFAN